MRARMNSKHAPDPALLAKAETLVEALPYMQRYAGKTFVVKYGGHAMGDEALMRLVITVFCATNPSPNASPAKSIESCARSAAVTEPMKGLSLYFRWEYTMSRCRLDTGMSTGSTTVPPDRCM